MRKPNRRSDTLFKVLAYYKKAAERSDRFRHVATGDERLTNAGPATPSQPPRTGH